MKFEAKSRLFRRATLLELGPDGIQLEESVHLAWSDLEDAGRFTTEYGTGLGLRLVDPVKWLTTHSKGKLSRVNSALKAQRSRGTLGDMLGLRDETTVPPPDLAGKVEWARRVTNGWDLTIGQGELATPAEEIAAQIHAFRAALG